jgi:lipopolysaccharide/colanic/teichoic acid biosynthesis glycosyltransferase
MRQEGIQLAAKKTMDRVLGAVALVALAPVMAAGAVAVRTSMGSPILFRHRRAGRGGRPFDALKLRTMTDQRDEKGELLPDADRLTRLGRLLRSASLDEVPQLWNVLRGEMSLVGPRPLPVEYLERYSEEQARRHEVMPGITGWVQVNGRNALDWDQKLALDIWYVDNWSLLLDLKILALTVIRVLQRQGISQEGHATMPVFMGSARQAEG